MSNFEASIGLVRALISMSKVSLSKSSREVPSFKEAT